MIFLGHPGLNSKLGVEIWLAADEIQGWQI